MNYRRENDLIGEKEVPEDAFYGIHTVRALENFPLSHRPVHPELITAYGTVKLACTRTNGILGAWKDETKFKAIEQACSDLASGILNDQIVVDCLQGGAGTSTNMNVNEVIANRALDIIGSPKGSYDVISPLDDVNLHQSTNDTYPTALKLAAIRLLENLENHIVALQEAFQSKEREFAHIVKVGRTQLQDAVLTTLGREMSAYADAFARDRWRIYKCKERLRVINLGGTAIGTGLGAPRQFIFRVTETLRNITGIGFARAENLIEATQNADVFVEVSGITKALSATLLKVAGDLRFMSSGPETGLGEIRLPERQAGSSIMPGKVNPVVPEAVSQAAILAMGYDQVIAMAASMGNLELNPFMPLIAMALLDSLDLLANACDIFRRLCVNGISADEARCKSHVETSTAVATALVPVLGYEKTSRLVKLALEKGISIRKAVVSQEILKEEEFNELISPEAVSRIGSTEKGRL
jgi:aspartate ammonia-lyase